MPFLGLTDTNSHRSGKSGEGVQLYNVPQKLGGGPLGLIDSAKDAAKLVQQIGNIELYEKLVSVQTDAMAMTEENWKLKEEVRSLKDDLRSLKQQIEVQGSLEYTTDGYYQTTDEGERDGPFCSVCWDIDRKLVRQAVGGIQVHYYFCMYCGNHRNKK